MPSTKVTIPHDSYVQVMPVSSTAFAVVDDPVRILFVRSATQPPADPKMGTNVGNGDQFSGSSAELTWCIAAGGFDGSVVVHDS